MLKINTAKDFARELSKAKGRTETVQAIVHDLLMYGLDQAITHRNVTPLNDVLALPGGLNHTGIAHWLAEYLPANVSGGKVKLKKADSDEWAQAQATKDETLKAAHAMPFYEMVTGADVRSPQATDYKAQILKILAKAKAEKGAGNPHGSTGLDQLNALFDAVPDGWKEDLEAKATTAQKRLSKSAA